VETEAWRQELADAVDDIDRLLDTLGLARRDLPYAVSDATGFPLRVPRYFVGLMRRGDPCDPLLLQVLPRATELAPSPPGFVRDPVGDGGAVLRPGLLAKYAGRVLMIASGACAIHCRYCFRRHFPYAGQTGARRLLDALVALDGETTVTELVLSGGDPLALSDRRLRELVEAAESLPQLRRLRIHTRLPVVLPSRVTAGLAELLSATRLKPVVVVHANHPREITPALGTALARLLQRRPDLALFNQSVLLKSVNDDADTLVALSEALFDIGVTPYYLHLLDKVVGAAQFDVPAAQGARLVEDMRRRLPGYLVPRLVREDARADSKTPVA
jgi:EF-P beta-lysylation protein EpmB